MLSSRLNICSPWVVATANSLPVGENFTDDVSTVARVVLVPSSTLLRFWFPWGKINK
jgi:hypothetical protein